ncbi:MAG: HAD family phosphatase [Flavobacteriaceae bacterium]|nr:HAD family phosphatase [Flavobacteriaceae bacterium]
MNTPKIDTIIFDFGGVLIDWNPEEIYLEAFNGDLKKVRWFLSEICPYEWNDNQDAGYPLAKATQDRIDLYPQYENLIKMYYGQWEKSIIGPITQTVDILNSIKKSESYQLYGLTNWSAETFPIAKNKYPFLDWFEGIVVSGEEKTRKPFPLIYQILLNRYKINPDKSVFIDDNIKNIKGAESAGIPAIHFTNPEKLIDDLNKMGVYF